MLTNLPDHGLIEIIGIVMILIVAMIAPALVMIYLDHRENRKNDDD